MNQFIRSVDRFFFQPISARGLGLMRVMWAGTIFAFMLMKWPDITMLYSDAGMLPNWLGESAVYRSSYRFTLLEFITEPGPVFGLYLTFLLTALCCMLGIWCRWTTILTWILLFSFHERNLLPLGGGDTVLRITGVLLVISPHLTCFSVDRLLQQAKNWRQFGNLLPTPNTSIWIYRLVLWQLICLYVTAGWDKFLGIMWLNGTAVASVFHHEHFMRWPAWVADTISIISPLASWFTLVFLLSWILLLIPDTYWRRWTKERCTHNRVRRWLLAAGVVFHGGICFMLDVGSFSFAMFTIYCGILLGEDFIMWRQWFNRRWPKRIAVLYDGKCGMCKRSVMVLKLCDWLHRLRLVDLHDSKTRKEVAPNIKLSDLKEAMHIKLPESGKEFAGFYAFRELCLHLPPLWLLYPVLMIPGVPTIGEKVYAHIAKNRCTGACKI